MILEGLLRARAEIPAFLGADRSGEHIPSLVPWFSEAVIWAQIRALPLAPREDLRKPFPHGRWVIRPVRFLQNSEG